MTVTVIDTLGPKNDGDFAVTEDTHQKGGWHAVADITARDAIPTARRKDGLIAYVVSEQKAYVWLSSAWQEYSASATGPVLYRLEETVTVEIDSLTGVNPTLPKPITRQSEVPAIPFATWRGLMAYLPDAIPAGKDFIIQLKSDLRPDSPTDYIPFEVPPVVTVVDAARAYAGYSGGIIVYGEKNELFSGISPISVTDAWRINFASLFTPSALKGCHVLVTNGTGAGQEILVRDNGVDWIELCGKASPVLSISSVLTIWEPKWRITGSYDDVTAHAYYGPVNSHGLSCRVDFFNIQFDGFSSAIIPPPPFINDQIVNSFYRCRFIRRGFAAEFQSLCNTRSLTQLLFYRCDFANFTAAASGYAFFFGARATAASDTYCSVVLNACYFRNTQLFAVDTQAHLYVWNCVIDASTTAPGMASRAMFSILRSGVLSLVSDGNGARGTALSASYGGTIINCASISGLSAVNCGNTRGWEGDTKLNLVGGTEIQNAYAAIQVWHSFRLNWTASAENCRAVNTLFSWIINDGARVHIPTAFRFVGGTTEILLDGTVYTFAELTAQGIISAAQSGSSIAVADVSTGHFHGTIRTGIAAFSTQTSKAITFAAKLPSANYTVFIAPIFSTVANFWASGHTATGFIINASVSISGNVSWIAVQI